MNLDKLKECLIYFVFRHSRNIQRTKLFKLVYLADLLSYQRRGRTITEVDYISYDYGPWSPLFYTALEEAPEIAERLGVSSFGDISYTYRGTVTQYEFKHLASEDVELLKEIDEQWAKRNLRDILNEVYSTPPFKATHFGEVIDFSKKPSNTQEKG